MIFEIITFLSCKGDIRGLSVLLVYGAAAYKVLSAADGCTAAPQVEQKACGKIHVSVGLRTFLQRALISVRRLYHFNRVNISPLF